MSPHPSSESELSLDAELEQIVDSTLDQMNQGLPVDFDIVARNYPHREQELRDLLPMMETLAQLGTPGNLQSRNLSARGHGEESPLVKQLGEFRLIREIGRGGMGIVFEAEQLSMGRIVALKVLPFAALVDDKSLQRFRNEVRAAAALDHPHIVPVYSIGQDRGVHFYAMQLIRGTTVAEAILELRNKSSLFGKSPTPPRSDIPLSLDGAPSSSRSSSSPADRFNSSTTKANTQAHQQTVLESRTPSERFRIAARIGIQAAEALQHAHDQAVLHRDMKPSNLLLDHEANVYVTDFGLARMETDAGLTIAGDVLGTLRYMPPEQAFPREAAIDHRTDIYSLGATLYELLALQPAFGETDRQKLLKQLENTDPPKLKSIDRNIPGDLDTIVAKAMAKHPSDRYQTAQRLADDLRAFLENRPIKAKPSTIVHRVAKWSRRHQKAALFTVIFCYLLAALLVVSIVLVNRARNEALAALAGRDELLYSSDIVEACQAWEMGWTDSAQVILNRQLPSESDVDRRRYDWRLLQALVKPPSSLPLLGHVGNVNELAIFPDRKRLASVGDDATLRIWNIGSGQLLKTIKLGRAPLHSIAISPDGRYVAAGANLLYLCDTQADYETHPIFLGLYTIESLAFSPDSRSLAAGLRYDAVFLFALDGSLLKRIPCASRVESLEFSPHSPHLILPNRRPNQNSSGFVQFWKSDLSTVEKEFDPVRSSQAVNSTIARLSPDGKYLLVGELYKSRAHLLNAHTGEYLAGTRPARDHLTDVAYSPDGRAIAVGYQDGTVEYYRLQIRNKSLLSIESHPQLFRAHQEGTKSIRFVDPVTLATSGNDGLVRVWNMQLADVVYQATDEAVEGIRHSPDGSQLLCMGLEHHTLLDSRTGEQLSRVDIPWADGSGSNWSASGDRLAYCSHDRDFVEVFDSRNRSLFKVQHGSPARAALFSPCGTQLAILGENRLQLCDGQTGKEQDRISLEGPGLAAAYSPCGSRLAYAGKFDAIHVIDPVTPQEHLHLEGGSETCCLAFSPDNSLIASGHADASIRIWEMPQGRLRTQFVGHERRVCDVAFSPDGRSLLSASDDGTVRLWSVALNRNCGVIHQGQDSRCRLSLSSDGRQLAVSQICENWQSRVFLWNIDAKPNAPTRRP